MVNTGGSSTRPERARALIGLVSAITLFALTGCATVVRVSQAVDGVEGNRTSSAPSVNFDGRWVSFASDASNLAPGDGNGVADVFLRDQQTGAIELVSRTVGGVSADLGGDEPSVSDDGSRIAFRSAATNLAGPVGTALTHIYVRDRTTGTTTRISVASDGTSANGMSDAPRISGNGRYVTFTSAASNLVTADGNDHWDVFVHDLVTGTTEAVSALANGTTAAGDSTAPAISADGDVIAFASTAANLVGGDTNSGSDVFRRDRTAATTTRVSVSTGGVQVGPGSAAPAISADGRLIAFTSSASNVIANDTNFATDVFVRNLNTLTTSMVSVDGGDVQGEGSSHHPTVSADGRYVAFVTPAQLVADDENHVEDIYVRDRLRAKTRRISTTTLQGEVHAPSRTPALSGDGASIAYASSASDLIDGDHNQADDVFVRVVTIPSISGATPTSIARGTSATLTVDGVGFQPGTMVVLAADGVTVDSVVVVSETKLTVHVTAAPSAPIGPAVMWVVLPGTGAGSSVASIGVCPCLTVS